MATFNSALWGGGFVPPDNSVTPRSMIYLVLRMIGVLRPGHEPQAESVNDCFTILNQMVDSWNTERNQIYSISRRPYNLAARSDYTYGPGGDFDDPRPPRVEGITFLSSSSSTDELPLRRLSLYEHQTQVSGYYLDMANPLMTVSLHPTPAAGNQAVVYAWVPQEGFPDLDTPFTFAPGYAAALRTNLAVEVYPMFRITMKIPEAEMSMIREAALKTKASIKRNNLQVHTMRLDSALVGGRMFDAVNWR